MVIQGTVHRQGGDAEVYWVEMDTMRGIRTFIAFGAMARTLHSFVSDNSKPVVIEYHATLDYDGEVEGVWYVRD